MGFFSDLSKDPAEPVPAPLAEEPVASAPAKAKAPRKKAAVAELPMLTAEPAPSTALVIAAPQTIVAPPRAKILAAEAWLDTGLHTEIPAERYHADRLAETPTLSSSLAKVILDRTPKHARLAHPRLNPDFEEKSEAKFSLGSVAHEIVLGRGGGFEVLAFDAYTTKAAKEARDAARDAGLTPILEEQFERALCMAGNVRAVLAEHDGCEDVFHADHGASEVVAIWRDPGGPLCRAMIDWLTRDAMNLWDLKTTGGGLDDETIGKAIENLGYDTSAAFYLRGMAAILPELAGRFGFRWVFVEDEAPHEARIFRPSAEMLAIGDRKAALAIAKWDRCMTSGEWPGWARQVQVAAYPKWGGETRWMPREETDPDGDRMMISSRPPPPLAPALDEPDPIHGEYPRNQDGRYGS